MMKWKRLDDNHLVLKCDLFQDDKIAFLSLDPESKHWIGEITYAPNGALIGFFNRPFQEILHMMTQYVWNWVQDIDGKFMDDWEEEILKLD